VPVRLGAVLKRRTVGFLSLIIACSHVAPFALAQVSTTGSVTSQVYNNVIEVDQMGQADWCQDVATACSHFSTLTDGVVLDARGFPPGSAQICGVQPLTNCGNNPFKLLIGPYEIDTSVGWVTPYQPHIIEGTTTSSGAPQGTFIIACGPGATNWNATNMNCGSVSYPKFPGSGPTIGFAFPHGPGQIFPASSTPPYSALIYDGAGTTSLASGWAVSAFNSQVRDIGLHCNNLANFAYLTGNEQENSGLFNVEGQSCLTTALPGAFAFWDRQLASVSGPAPTHFSAQRINYKQNTSTSGGYGLVWDESAAQVVFTGGGCVPEPTAYAVIGNGLTAGEITGLVLTNGGSGCTSTPSCSINATVGTPGAGQACTAGTESGGSIPSVSISCSSGLPCGSGYGGFAFDGPRKIQEFTLVGNKVGTTVYALAGGVAGNGFNSVIEAGHIEFFDGDAVALGGGTFPAIGSSVRDINVVNYTTGAGNANSVVHLFSNGSSYPMNAVVENIVKDQNDAVLPTVLDDENGVNCATGNAMPLYVGSYFLDCNGTLTVLASTVHSSAGAASQAGLAVSGAPYTGGTGTTNFPQLYVNTSGSTGPSTFSTSGTMFGINAPSGFSGNLVDTFVNGTGKFTVQAAGGAIAQRLSVDKGTTLVAGSFTLSASWGTVASTSITVSTSKDQANVSTITAGSTPAANPTYTLTFTDGTWINTPVCVAAQTGGNGATSAINPLVVSARSATAYTWRWTGTPVSGDTYEITISCMGT
jgi:hypothetical protein